MSTTALRAAALGEHDTKNPFSGSAPAARPNTTTAVTAVEQQRAIAEVQAAMMIARANPRDPVACMDRILNACTRPTLADAAVYSYSRGGQDISGPSIRLAEVLAQGWQNMQFGIRELAQGHGESTVQAFCWDVENNTRREVTFQVPHERHTKKGVTKLTDPRDVYELVANQGARRLRACILSVIPGDVVEAAVNQCETTMKAKADTSPEGLAKIVEAFRAWGVTKEQIEKRIQRRLDAIQPAQVVMLKKIYASLRDGMSVAADWFDPLDMTPPTAKGDQFRGTDDDFEPEVPGPAIDDTSLAPQGFTASQICDLIEAAETAARLDEIKAMPVEYADDAEREIVRDALASKLRSLTRKK